MVNNNSNIGVYIDKVASYVPFVSTGNVGLNLLTRAIMDVKGIKDPKSPYLKHIKNKTKARLTVESIPFGNFAGLAADIKKAWGSKSKETAVNAEIDAKAADESPRSGSPRPASTASTPRPKLTLKSASTVLLRPFSARPQSPIGTRSAPTGRMRDVISTELRAIDKVAKRREDLEELFSQGMHQLELGNQDLAIDSIKAASRQGYIPAQRQYALMMIEQGKTDFMGILKSVALRGKYDKNNELTEIDKVTVRQANADLCKFVLQDEKHPLPEKYDVAKEYLDKAQDPDLDYVYQYLGQNYYDLSEKSDDPAEKTDFLAKSKECLEKAKIQDAYYELASIYLDEGNQPKAAELYQLGKAAQDRSFDHIKGTEPYTFDREQIMGKLLKMRA